MDINISKKDIVWSYLGYIFQMGSGVIVLPMVLHKLSPEEVGMNYLMLTIASIVSLLDFGFAPQFARTITYVFSGAKELKKEGIVEGTDTEVDYKLLATVIKTAKYIYKRLSVIVLLIMLTLGTGYIYYVTEGFTKVEDSLYIWILFAFSTYFNIYFTYYSSLLLGAALIKESKQAAILSKSVYIIIAYTMLLANCGLISIVAANFISPFVSRFYSYYKFYTPELKEKLCVEICINDIKKTFSILWYNAKKLGINFVGAYAINKSNMFLAGLFLSLSEIGSFGLMIQLFTILSSASNLLFTTISPKFSQYRVQGNQDMLIRDFSYSMIIYYVMFIAGALVIAFTGNHILEFMSTKTYLPSFSILLVYAIILLLEGNHSSFATIIVTNNEVPFVKAALLSGGFIVLFTYLSLAFTNWGLWGVILVQGLVQLSYNNWKWPSYVLKGFNIRFSRFIMIGIKETYNKIAHL